VAPLRRRWLAHAPLTRLSNRSDFEHQLGVLLAREPKQGATVPMIGLDGLQVLNDLFGHTGGDACLVQAAGLRSSRVLLLEFLAG
jgi:diguanylate cyclase (GGDEF)-like protein